jgi:SPP1 gp7 family putative phage head morphogenesis protein
MEPAAWHLDVRTTRGRNKLARGLQPSRKAEAQYVHDLVAILGEIHRGVLRVAEDIHKLPPIALHQDVTRYVPGPGLGDRLLFRIMQWQVPRVRSAFDRMAKTVADWSHRSHALIGINPRHIAGVESVIEHAREENVKLITRASQTFLDQVREVLESTEGMTADEVRDALEERVQVSRSRAQLVARDQTLKLNSQVAQHRMRAAGVNEYIWSTSGDERVRPIHAELEGQRFSWDSPPVTSEQGDRNNPGEDYQCRCIAIPFVPELDEAPEEEEEAEAAE